MSLHLILPLEAGNELSLFHPLPLPLSHDLTESHGDKLLGVSGDRLRRCRSSPPPTLSVLRDYGTTRQSTAPRITEGLGSYMVECNNKWQTVAPCVLCAHKGNENTSDTINWARGTTRGDACPKPVVMIRPC